MPGTLQKVEGDLSHQHHLINLVGRTDGWTVLQLWKIDWCGSFLPKSGNSRISTTLFWTFRAMSKFTV